MKQTFFLTILLVLSFSCHSNKEQLFNGSDLDNWIIFASDSTIKPQEYFYVNDGMIETTGVPIGYMRTKKEYSNYKLHLEWRYPEAPTNSGILLHTTGPDMIWVSHYQGQLKYQNAGDFIIHGIGESATINDTVYTSTKDVKPLIPKMSPTNENPAGEWNRYDIICNGDRIELFVNGMLQNVATHCSKTKGAIGLQAEGSKIQFRNLWVEDLK